jgi:FKBP-type peptidyl-prolyl cis-trans isomerases 1
MKKNNIIIVALVLVVSLFTACENKKPKDVLSSLKNQNDSLNYAYGIAVGNSLKMYYMQSTDTTDAAIAAQIDSLFSGIAEGLKSKSDGESSELTETGKGFGAYIKEQEKNGFLGDSTLSMNLAIMKQGIINGLKNYNDILTTEEASQYINNVMTMRMFGENKTLGEEFLKANLKRPEVIATPSGLQYEVLLAGKGAIPTEADQVRVHYHGTLIDGTVFDSSVERGESITFPLTGVIRGWTEALQLMPVGSKWKLYIPQELAYGESNQGTIKPYSALIFEVELLGIE